MTDTATVSDREQSSGGERAQLRLRWVVALTSAAYFTVVLDASVLITALPRM
jgi:hypothetical protein